MSKRKRLRIPEHSGAEHVIPTRVRSETRADPVLKRIPGGLRGRPPRWLTGSPKGGRGSVTTAPQADTRRRVIAKLSYVQRGARYAGKVAANAKYLARKDALDHDVDAGHERYLAREGPFFSERTDGITATQVADACAHDRRQFRLIISPNDGERLDMKPFVREYMARVERATGTRLAWSAVIHKAETVAHECNRHAHIVIRGTDLYGREVRFNRAFVKEGFRAVAEDLATEKLGPMNERSSSPASDSSRR